MPVSRDPLTAVGPLRKVAKANGFAPRTIYALAAAGKIQTIVINSRRFIMMASFWDYLDAAEAEGDRPALTPPAPPRKGRGRPRKPPELPLRDTESESATPASS